MAWKRRHTTATVDVELDEFSAAELLQGLVDARWLSEAEAEAIEARAKLNDRSTHVLELTPDTESYAEAYSALRGGRRGEAVILLERFLGRDWIGVLQ